VEGRPASVHLAEFPLPDGLATGEQSEALIADWKVLLKARTEVLAELEEKRRTKQIGKALEAKVRLRVLVSVYESLNRYPREALKELLNVSEVSIESPGLMDTGESLAGVGSDTPQVTVSLADGIKCERCWNYRTDTAAYGPWPVVCGRCANALNEMGYAELNASVAQ